MDNNKITIYTDKKKIKIYSFFRDNLIKLEKQYPLKSEGYGSFGHSKRLENIHTLIKILQDNESSEIDVSDLAKSMVVCSAKVKEYLSQIDYSLCHLI